jgi:MinD-like ATPase involved in chromosome partitioning or flagellar assembly
VDLPTYTNIWRIEKRLYKLYDFRLPAPLPITWIAVFAGITVPYIVFLVAIGLPFNHNVVWLYILPPGVLTWLTTRPVIESKRLPELVGSQLRYLAEPRTWCRMAPFAEKDGIFLTVRVWHRDPREERPERTRKATAGVRPGQKVRRAAVAARVRPGQKVPRAAVAARVRPGQKVRRMAVAAGSAAASRVAAAPAASRPARSSPSSGPAPASPRPAVSPAPSVAAAPSVPQRATAQPEASRTRAARQRPATPESDTRPSAPAEPEPGVTQRPARAVAPPAREQESRALEVSHVPEPDPDDLWEPRPAVASVLWPPAGPAAFPAAGAFPEVGPFPEVGAFPEVGPDLEADGAPEADVSPLAEAGSRADPALELEPLPDPGLAAAFLSAPVPHAAPAPPPRATPRRATPVPAAPRRSMAAKVAALFVDLDAGRPVPSVERALSGPDSQEDTSWQRQVKVVTGGRGPGQRNQQAVDRERARRPLAGPRRIAVLGCTSGAGQSMTALMIGRVLADVREVPVAALDLNPGDASLAACIAPATSVTALLAHSGPDAQLREDPKSGPARRGPRTRPGRGDSGPRLDVIALGPPGTGAAHPLDADDYQRLVGLLAARYPLTMIDPAPSGLTRVLPLADQLVLVVPASPDAATSLANTQQWLTAHGYHGLAARAVTVVNGVSNRTSQDVLLAESVARGRCRAIVRVPWDDRLSPWPATPAELQPQTKLAYTALAGVLVAGLEPGTAGPRTSVRGRSAGEHPD